MARTYANDQKLTEQPYSKNLISTAVLQFSRCASFKNVATRRTYTTLQPTQPGRTNQWPGVPGVPQRCSATRGRAAPWQCRKTGFMTRRTGGRG